ncbi:MAG TPA: hypothetical protein VFM37_09365, partial [Pseudonocardiaceae bacterium]|nr:hypothetical protein [Pseudonocardiaceae bacterium]
MTVGVFFGGLASWGIASALTFLATVDSLPRFVVPGRAQLGLAAGLYTVYSEAPTGTADAMSNPRAMPGFGCRLTGPSGAAVPVVPAAGEHAYPVGSYTGTARYGFRAPADGRYRLHGDYRGPGGPSIVLAVSRDGPSWALVTLVAAIGASATGLVTTITVRHRRLSRQNPHRRLSRQDPHRRLSRQDPHRRLSGAPAVAGAGPAQPPPTSPALPAAVVGIAAIVAVVASAIVIVAATATILVPARRQGTVLVAGTPATAGVGTPRAGEP